MRRKRLVLLTLLVSLIAIGGLTSGCSSPDKTAEHTHPMAPLDEMPDDVQAAPVAVREAYQYAVANPEVLQELPCYCGCGAMGHTSNYACYVASVDAAGAITFDPHALGCSICVDITQDAMRLQSQGKTVGEIRAYVDSNYAKYGPSNIP